jgi:hypothetical protein
MPRLPPVTRTEREVCSGMMESAMVDQPISDEYVTAKAVTQRWVGVLYSVRATDG